MADELKKQVAILAAHSVDEAVIDGGLLTSRDPGDLTSFRRTIVQEFAKHARSATGAHTQSN